jgi:hypothetical protein
MIIRNDDISYDSNLDHVKRFCELCDKHGFKILHAITPLGITHNIDSSWSDSRIVCNSAKFTLADNKALLEYLLTRADLTGTHGLWHSHAPSASDQRISKAILEEWGFNPTYAVLPFNEESSEYREEVHGMKVLGKSQRLEDYLIGMPKAGELPTEEIIYCHEWRFGLWYTWENLDQTLERIRNAIQRSN